MKKNSSIKINFIMNIFLTLSTFVFQLITFPYVSRILLPEGVGRVSFAISFISYFNMFAQLGIPTYGIRACAAIRDNEEELTRTVHELLFINLVMCMVSYIFLFFSLAFVPKLKEDRVLYLIVSSNIILWSIGVEWLYKALEKYSYIAIRSIIFKLIALGLMIFFVHKESDYIVYGLVTVVASSLSYVLNFINARKYIGFKSVGKYNFSRHLKPIAVFFAMSFATTIYTNLDEVMLGFMSSKIDVGLYDAAVKIRKILVSIVTSLGVVLLPRTSYYVEHGLLKEFYSILKKAMDFVLLLATPMMIYFMIFAREGIYFLSGDSFRGAITPMQIIMPTVLLVGMSNVIGIQTLIPLGKEKEVLISEIFGATGDLVLNLFLIPRYAAIGAAIGTLIAEFIVLYVQVFYLTKYHKGLFKNIKVYNILMGSVLASVSAYIVKALNLIPFFALFASASIFFVVYTTYLYVRKEQLVVNLLESIKTKFKK